MNLAYRFRKPLILHRRVSHESPSSSCCRSHSSSSDDSAFGYSTNFLKDYEMKQPIGSGGFATIYKAVHHATGQERAVKRISKKKFGSQVDDVTFKRIQNECDVLTRLNSSLNTVSLYALYEDASSVSLVLELCTGGDLERRRRERPGQFFSEVEARPILHEALSAMAQCHQRQIVHRDIKPSNFLFLEAKSDRLRMIDFGLATFCLNHKLTDKVGSFPYISPDVLKQSYSLSSDIWSLGVVFFELLTARLPFLDEDGEALTSDHKLKSKEWSGAICLGELDLVSSALSSDALDLLFLMLERDPDHRITAQHALSHPWFNSIGQLGTSQSEAFSIVEQTVCQRLQRWGASPKLKRKALTRIMSLLLEGEETRSSLSSLLNLPPPSILSNKQFDLTESEKTFLMSPFGAKEEIWVQWCAALVDWGEIQVGLGGDDWRLVIEKAYGSFFSVSSSVEMELSIEELDEVLCGSSTEARSEQCPIPDSLPQSLREIGHMEKPSLVKIDLIEFHALVSEVEDYANFENCLVTQPVLAIN